MILHSRFVQTNDIIDHCKQFHETQTKDLKQFSNYYFFFHPHDHIRNATACFQYIANQVQTEIHIEHRA